MNNNLKKKPPINKRKTPLSSEIIVYFLLVYCMRLYSVCAYIVALEGYFKIVQMSLLPTFVVIVGYIIRV